VGGEANVQLVGVIVSVCVFVCCFVRLRPWTASLGWLWNINDKPRRQTKQQQLTNQKQTTAIKKSN